MNNYFLIILLIGLAAFGLAWIPAISKLTGISFSIIYLLAGVLIYTFFPNVLPRADVMAKGGLTGTDQSEAVGMVLLHERLLQHFGGLPGCRAILKG
ncbi:MAG: hypothetical protein ACOH2A_15705, partial [Sphingobacteriaceae bacterium]